MIRNVIMPFVSVIIPAYNEEKYIKQCIKSVLDQDYPENCFEILVIDNGSTDATYRIAEQLLGSEGRGRVINKIGGTIASIRNYGWQNAKGEVLAFLDGDSVVDPQWLNCSLELLLLNNDIACVGFAMAPPSIESHWVQKAWYDVGNSSRHKGTKQVKWLCSFNLVLKKEFFNRVNGFNEALVTGEDYELGLKLNDIGSVIFSDTLHVKHLDNINSTLSFLTKEFWRGRGEVYTFLKSNKSISGFISTIIPIIYTLSVVILLTNIIFFNNIYIIMFCSLILMLLPLVMLIMKNIFSIDKLIRGYAFYVLYFFTHGLAAFVPKKAI